ncbi:anti-sigma factor [Streptomyces sp. UNOC14_S4]|uniref:anti-sigma factor family protein n=1 Tax=Streptomyces sp. UNOC14_S4 TaxID=2872340 RepID=UPI001E30A47D|nr:anti-sigma factor [Streptomyces sp. UNOC14_S4]MCC3772383.1 zf-HC2 domain-containing protein [Streptomyces sp. UNOC14_S4]
MNRPAPHTDVGAYALGALEQDDAARFEEHLADCPECAAELDGLLGLTPLLADLKEATPDPDTLTARPGPGFLDGLLGRAAAVRRAQRVRRRCLAAAAAVLIVAGPLVGAALTAHRTPDRTPDHSSVSAARQMYEEGEKYGAVDPVTKVDATVSLEDKPWGTHAALRLAHVKGPLTCDLVAVGRNGQRQTVTTWAVPAAGYGLEGGEKSDKWSKEPLYTHGGAAFPRNDIDHFEVRTLDGKLLATVKV